MMTAGITRTLIRSNQDVYQWTTLGGLAVFGSTFAMGGIIAMAFGYTEHISYFVLFSALSLAMGVLVLQFGTGASLIAVTFGLSSLYFLAPFLSEALSHPDSFLNFAPALVLTSGTLIVVAGATGLFLHRRQAKAAGPTFRRQSIALLLVLSALAGLAVFSGVATLNSINRDSLHLPHGEALSVSMRGLNYHPPLLLMSTEDQPELVIANNDFTMHTFTIPELGIDLFLPPGVESAIHVPVSASGRFEFICTIKGHESMKGVLVLGS